MQWDGFKDFVRTLKLSRGKALDAEDNETAGELKAMFRLYPLPDDRLAPLPPRALDKIPPSTGPVECLLRVYCIRALALQSNDPNGLSDPYISIRLGDAEYDNRKEYIANTLEPIFGRYSYCTIFYCVSPMLY